MHENKSLIYSIQEELWKLKYFTQKNPLKETKILQDIIIITLY
jgi:hypothetical protein